LVFVTHTITALHGQANQAEYFKSIERIKNVSELIRIQGKLRLAKQHEDSLNLGIVQTNWIVRKWKRYSTTYLITLSVGDKIFYREFHRQYLTEDFENWYSKTIYVSTDSAILNKLNKLQNSKYKCNIEVDHLTHLPERATFGYACQGSAIMPGDGMKMKALVIKKDTATLESWIRSVNPVKQAYSYLALRVLQSKDSIALSPKTEQIMKELESSSKIIFSCSGCVFLTHLPIKAQLSPDNVKYFVDRMMKTK